MQQKLFLFNQKSESTQIVPKVNVMKTAVQTDNISLIKSSRNRTISFDRITYRNENSYLHNQLYLCSLYCHIVIISYYCMVTEYCF